MASHGVPRVSGEKTEQARQHELKKIEEYRHLADQVNTAIDTKRDARECLELTSKLLTLNPEYYTVWNHRRRLLLRLYEDVDDSQEIEDAKDAKDAKDVKNRDNSHPSEQHIQNLLTSDITFLMPLLLKVPKCYWIWNHRGWLLQQFSVRLPVETALVQWRLEMGLVDKMLGRDNRNFHGWTYRRVVVEALRRLEMELLQKQQHLTTSSSDETTPNPTANKDKHSTQPEPSPSPSSTLTRLEFEYTSRMINGNLSNFSAWHNRSKLIPRLLSEQHATPAQRRKMFDDELALIQRALFTDPYDQSLWFYHEHLMTVLLGVYTPDRDSEVDDAGDGDSKSNGDGKSKADGESNENETSDIFAPFKPSEKLQYLKKEIIDIRELLEDTDDCKWIYQYLLLYTARYLEIERSESKSESESRIKSESESEGEGKNENENERFIPSTELHSWFECLCRLDPLRIERWKDLQRTLKLQV